MSEPFSIEQAQQRLSELVESVTTKRERVTISTPAGEVVLMNAADLEGLEETLEIMRDPEELAAIQQGSAEAAGGEFVGVDDLR